jgi:hypothetical protein
MFDCGPRSRHGHKTLKPWIWAGRGVEHCRELLELVGIHAEKNLVEYYRLRG